MSRAEILKHLEENYAELKERHGIVALALFGSAARDEARQDSDIDVLVNFKEPPTFDQYMELKFHLEDLLGGRVDLVTQRGLRDRVRPFVEKEAVYVA